MTRLIDGLAPHHGPMILQDFSFEQRGGNVATRGGQYGVRVIGRQDGKAGLGTWEEDAEFRGDLSGLWYWQRASREVGTWREIMPVMRPFTAETPSAPGLDQPAGGLPPNSRTPSDRPTGPTTPSGGADYAAAGGASGTPGATGPGGGGNFLGPVPDQPGGSNAPPPNDPPPSGGASLPGFGQGSTNSGKNQGDVGWSSDTGWEYGAGDSPTNQSDVRNASRDQDSIVWNPDTGWEYGDQGSDTIGGQDGSSDTGESGPEGPTGKKNAPMVPEQARGVAFKPPQHFFLPVKGRNPSPDTSFARALPIVPQQNGQAAIPGIPGGMMGFMCRSSDVGRQYDYWFSGDPRLFVAHRGNPAYGTLVCDIEGDSINNSVRASLQSVFRIVRQPRGDLSMRNGSANVLAWNIGVTGQGESIGSMIADKSGASTWLGMPSVRDGGPFDVTDGCIHKLGSSGTGDPISPVHFSDRTFWRNQVGDEQHDGPMMFEDGWPDPDDLIYPAKVHLGWDKDAEYKWPRDAPTKSGTGMWRWWTSSVINFGGGGGGGPPEDANPPQTPGGDGEPPTTPGDDPGGPVSPRDPEGPVADPGGFVPGPETPGGRKGPSPDPGGDPSGPTRAPTKPPSPPRPPRKPGRGPAWPETIVSGNSLDLRERPFGYTHVQMALPSLLAKPMRVENGAEDITTSKSPKEWSDWFDRAPLTMRMFAFGAQGGETGGPYIDREGGGTEVEGGPWAYTHEPGQSRHRAGTADGGLAFGPPEIDASDADTDYAPQGIAVSTPTMLALPGARFGIGSPELATGGVRSGYTWGSDGADGMRFFRHDQVGSNASVLVLDASGNAAFDGEVKAVSFNPNTAQTYTPTNVTTDRTYDANSTTVAELADVLGTLIADLQTLKLLD